jgi:hypothetical protein
MSLEAVVGVSSAETIVEALLVGYTQLQTERNLRVREWPLIFSSDLEFLRLVEPEWIDRARSWDFLFFWFSRMFYRHANRYQEKLHVISANIHAIWNLRQAMNLDALLNRRPQRRPDFGQGNLPGVPLPQAAVSTVGPGAPPPPVVEVTRQDGPPPTPTFATANVNLVQIKGEPQPPEEEAPPGPPLAQLLRPAPPPVAVRLISPEEPTSSAPCVSPPSHAPSHATVQRVDAALRPLSSAAVWTTSTTRPSMPPGTRAPNPRWMN